MIGEIILILLGLIAVVVIALIFAVPMFINHVIDEGERMKELQTESDMFNYYEGKR